MAKQNFISFDCPDDMSAALREIAAKQQRPVSSVIRDAINQYLAGGVVIVPVRGLLDSKTRVPGAAE